MAYPLSPQVTFDPPTGGIVRYPTGSAANTLAATGFIPEIWSGKMVEKFYNSTVLAAISNTDYEGEIKSFGDKVHIRTKPTITIKKYAADGLLEPDRPAGGEVILNIDQGRYWNTILDDVMRTQSDINLLSIWAEDAAEQMKITIDTDVLLNILGQCAAVNEGTLSGAASLNLNLGVTGTPLLLAATAGSGVVDILDCILRLGQTLDEQNIPETGRWLVLPAWAATLIKRSELRQAYLSGDAVSMLRNGRIGMVDRFTIYSSNLLPKGAITSPATLAAGETVMYAGHPHALTFASQMTEMEVMRSEHTFGNLQRGLQVYGYKVVAPVALAQAIIKPAP
jgi:hypothetical protein